ncbi:hypothetical protein K439DRAFT_1631280 [Ramaria rubella]|nr:hypothetical protein K439DRAFT_1631280 [Ramaria rubella]
MAPITQAVCTTFLGEIGDVRVYNGDVDNTWTMLAVPQGGYVLGLVINACMASQAQTDHTEVAHITGHFLRTTSLSHFEVHIRTVRIGKFYSNLTADLIQKNETKVSAQLVFKARFISRDAALMTLAPPSPYARRIPLHLHPSVAPLTPVWGNASFGTHVRWAEDKTIRERNRALGRGQGPRVGGGGLEWGSWFQLLDVGEEVNAALLPFLGDMMKNLYELLPKEQRPASVWYPTMVFSLEYKAGITDDPAFSKHTVGLYSCSRFMHEGRHDVYVEIWTAPGGIGEGVEEDGWRDKQVCIGIAHQMALTVPSTVNTRTAVEANGKL